MNDDAWLGDALFVLWCIAGLSFVAIVVLAVLALMPNTIDADRRKRPQARRSPDGRASEP